MGMTARLETDVLVRFAHQWLYAHGQCDHEATKRSRASVFAPRDHHARDMAVRPAL
jgi:hypothetical protein